MDWTRLTTYRVQEVGGASHDVSLLNSNKSKAALDVKIQQAFGTSAAIHAIRREDGSAVDNDLAVVFLPQGAPLEVEFSGKFYWLVSDTLRHQWSQEFRQAVGTDTLLSGEKSRALFTQSQVTVSDLAVIWQLADTDQDGFLNIIEFLLAKFLIHAREQGQSLPATIPHSLLASVSSQRQLPQRVLPKRMRSESRGDTRNLPSPSSLPIAPTPERGRHLAVSSNTAVPLNNLTLADDVERSASAETALDMQRVAPLKQEVAWTITKSMWKAYTKLFDESNSGLERTQLAQIWTLADLDGDSQLNKLEFFIALFFIAHRMKGFTLPRHTPQALIESIREEQATSPTKKKRLRPPSDRGHRRQTSSPSVLPPPSTDYSPPTYPKLSAMPTIASSSTPSPLVVPSPSNTPSPSLPHPHQHHPPPAAPSIPTTPSSLPQPTPFAPVPQIAPVHAPDIGPFPLPEAPAPPDLIRGIAADLLARSPSYLNAPAPAPPPSALVEASERTLVGVQKFAPEEVHRETLIGGGSFASVWKGIVSGETVAIKDMSYRSEKEIDMWRREVQLLSHLQNYNYLVKIKGYLVTKEHLSIVMEFMDGGSLYDVVHKEGRVPWSMLKKARILRHIAKGVDSIHKEGIVHRDLKSMNVLHSPATFHTHKKAIIPSFAILIRSNRKLDSKGVAKIADLGCSRFLREETMTIGIGSPLWMSPEVQKGGAYNFSADVFSYGVICYEVFNEHLPDYDIDHRIVVIPPDCIGYTVIRECIQRNPNRRPTAQQLIESMDVLISSFVSTVARVVLSNYRGDTQELPRPDDLSAWYNLLLAYDRDTFDVLLSSGMNTVGRV